MATRTKHRPDHGFEAWSDALLANPAATVADILEGRGGRGALQLAGPDHFLSGLVAQPSQRHRRDALVQAIDGSLIEWMEERSIWPPSRVAGYGTRAYVAQLADALAVVAHLPLSATPTQLIDDVGRWDDRLRSMRLPDDIDLLRQFDIALAQHQHDEGLVPRWFASCDEAAWAGPYWRDDLGIGLLGLRKVPDPTKSQPERLVATALARFAALSSERKTDAAELRAEFRRQASTLATLYPRHHSRWKAIWASALASISAFDDHRTVAQDDWLRPAIPKECFPDIDAVRNVPALSNWAGPARRPARLPPLEKFDAAVLAVDTAKSLDHGIWSGAHALLEGHWAYARYAHHSYYAVRTTHNLCDRLLRKRPSDAQLQQIHNWTLAALRAENGNAYIWDLWAKVLAASGAAETALDIRWEAVRRFPDNLVTRMAMIVALAGNGRHELARSLYDETEQDFPNQAIEPRLLRPEEWGTAPSEKTTRHIRAPLAEQLRRVIPDERLFCAAGAWHSRMEVEPPVSTVLDYLHNRTTLLERYFAPSGDAVEAGTATPAVPASELELVVACRIGTQPSDGLLESWLEVHPASYSAQLLALSKGINGHGPDPDAFSRVRSAFPQHRHWNQWLGYALSAPEEHDELRREAKMEGLWGGRLGAVYPGLDGPPLNHGAPDTFRLRRLFEDVALANADTNLPPLPP